MSTLVRRLYSLLRQTERYTKTDMVYLASGGLWLAVGQAAAAVTAFVFSLAVAHYVSKEVFGAYKYVLSLVSILGALSLSGLTTTTVRLVARNNDAAIHHSFYTSLRWSGLMLFGFFLTILYYLYQGAYGIALSLGIACIATTINNAASLYGCYWSGKKDFYHNTLYWIMANTLTVSATIMAMSLTQSLLVLVGTYLGTSAAVSLFLYHRTARTIPRVPKTIEEEHADRESVHLSLLNFLNNLSSQADKVIIFHLLGPADLAIYTFALAMPEQLRAVLKAGARLALPRFAERDFAHIQQSLTLRLVRFSIVILGITIAYVVAAPYLYELLFPAYLVSLPYSQIFALTLFTALGSIPLAALQAHAKVRALYIHAILTNLIQIICGISLIWLFGLWGAALSAIITRATNLVVPLYLFSSETPVRE